MMKKIPMKILCITVLTVCLAAVPGFAYADDFVIDDPGSISVTLPEDETSEQDSPQNPEEPAQNPAQRAFRTLHNERSRNYTRSGTQTYILFLNTNLANGTNERE